MPIVLTALLVFMSVADFLPDSPLRLGFVKNAEAIIGMPWTPLSFAGVARRSMYREAAWNAAAVTLPLPMLLPRMLAYANACCGADCGRECRRCSGCRSQRCCRRRERPELPLPIGTVVPYLPPGCTSTVISGVNYFNCAGVYYRAGFQGNNVVYIVSAP